MKTKFLIPILLIVFIFSFTACTTLKTAAETTTAEEISTASKTTAAEITASEITATADTTTVAAPGSVHAQEYQVVEAVQEYWVGDTWGFILNKGEKAFLDQDGKVLEIQDAQGRVKLENFGEFRFRFYAWEDGFDVIVGGGFLLLNAGNSYTFEWPAEQGNPPQQAEVRLISNDQLIGYALLIMNYNSDGAFTGLEKPIAFVDSNGDGLLSIQELNAALAGLCEEVNLIAESQPSLATSFEADITSAYAMGNSGAIADAYQKIKQIQLDTVQAAKN